jgi:hypothetical protein
MDIHGSSIYHANKWMMDKSMDFSSIASLCWELGIDYYQTIEVKK